MAFQEFEQAAQCVAKLDKFRKDAENIAAEPDEKLKEYSAAKQKAETLMSQAAAEVLAEAEPPEDGVREI